LFKLERNGGPTPQESHKQDFIFVSSACKVSTKSVAESVASRKHKLWRGSLYRIERNQLSLKAENESLALINVDLKANALFIKNMLTIRVE
jgi:hypothetical protein